MFGCLFASSSGRCTKGVYGSILELKNNKKYDYILIIDSEGLQNPEKKDTEFDRKICCFRFSKIMILVFVVLSISFSFPHFNLFINNNNNFPAFIMNVKSHLLPKFPASWLVLWVF